MVKSLLSKKKVAALQQLLGQAMRLHQSGLLAQAEALYAQALDLNPRQAEAQHLLGVLRGQQGRYEEALTLIGAALKIQPGSFVALSDYGLVLSKLHRYENALAAFDKALAIKPDYVPALSNRSNVLSESGHHQEALAGYDAALRIKPDYPDALYNRAIALAALGSFDDALTGFDRVLALRPDHAPLLVNRANVLAALDRPQEALASADKAVAIDPANAQAHYSRGNILVALKRYEDALAAYDRALQTRSDYAEALDNRGNVLMQLKRREEALASYERAVAFRPDYAGALNNRGTALKELGRHEEALASFDRALAIDPGFADALYNRGNALKELRRYNEAVVAYYDARRIKPEHPDAFGHVDAVAALCDWDEAERLTAELALRIADTPAFVGPFTWLGLCDDPLLQLKCARNYIADKVPTRPDPLWKGEVFRNERIRVAYLSADFHQHATAFLIAELFELHDRARFEIVGVSFGRDDGSPMRRRLAAGFDEFLDVQSCSDRDIAMLLRDRHIDIAVDLKGYTQDSRPEILAFRPAPIQLNYLGYPGTMGADFIDYIIADQVVLPLDQQHVYAEKIVHLPDCYQVNDRKRTIGDGAPTRADVGLSPQSFVFCCFNNNYKITRPVFAMWMRLLQNVPGSVLWLLRDNAGAERNLRQAATAHGIDAERLVFAERKPLDAHLARHGLADLALDTLPYNAHTTASDALWAGVPMVTCEGRAFAGRVGSSVLRAIGLRELVTANLGDYESLAQRLATDPPVLAAVRAKLRQNRAVQTLFDADRFRTRLEAAYLTMWETWQRGDSPRAFRVE